MSFFFLGGGGQQLFLTETKMKNFTSCFKDKHFLRFFFRWFKIEIEKPLTCIPRSKFKFFAAAWGSTTAGGTFPISPSSPTADQRGTLSGVTTHRSSSQTSFKVSGKTMIFLKKHPLFSRIVWTMCGKVLVKTIYSRYVVVSKGKKVTNLHICLLLCSLHLLRKWERKALFFSRCFRVRWCPPCDEPRRPIPDLCVRPVLPLLRSLHGREAVPLSLR